MSTIADYSVFTKAFLASGMTDFSQLYTNLNGEGERAFAVIPFYLETPLTPREAMNFDTNNFNANKRFGENVNFSVTPTENLVSCNDADGNFIGNIVRVQPIVRNGSIRLVAKVAVPVVASSEGGEVNTTDAPFNTFVLVRTSPCSGMNLPIAVATISKGYNLHRHKVVGNDPLDDVENANYVSFTINNLNGYTSVDFNPDAYATYDDVANALSRGIDGLHIAFDTASGDLKLLDKDGNVLDQANLPIKTDVIIAEGEEGYKYVKTDVKQDIHAAKAWMPEGKTAWEEVPEAPYTMQHAALVVDKASTPASREFIEEKVLTRHPISTEPVQYNHFLIDDSTYMVVVKNETETTCNLLKVKGKAEAPSVISPVDLSGGQVTHGGQSYAITNEPVEVDVIKGEDGVTTYVLAGTNSSDMFQARTLDGGYTQLNQGRIVTFGGSTTASRVFVDQLSGSYPISTEPVQFEHVVIGDSTYMVVDKTNTNCNLIKVKGKAEATLEISAGISEEKVTLNDSSDQYPIANSDVEVDVIKDKDGVTTYVLVGPYPNGEFRALSIGGNYRVQYSGIIVTSEGSSTGEVLGIALADQEGTKMYTFDEGAQPHAVIKNISGSDVRWLDIKPLTEVPNHTLKYGLEAFVWTVKDAEAGKKIIDPFFNQLNASLLALGFHEGDDIALGTNLSILAPTGGVSPLNKVDADDYIHGKNNKATREQEVDTQRANAKDELVAWNAQHPTLTEDREHGTIIDHTGLDVRNGSITLGCGRIGEAGVYGIQMKDHSSDQNIQGRSESLDFTISHTTGNVQFDENGHATNLTSSTLLSIEAGSYISGAPTCLILAEVTHNSDSNSEGSPTVFTPVRMTAGFSVASSYNASSGLNLTIYDDRENISAVFVGPNNNTIESSPAIIEVQAIYTHPDAHDETVPAQQMHTYIGSWVQGNPRSCSFLCNKIEEWMTAVGLADTTPAEGVQLYVVIRVY